MPKRDPLGIGKPYCLYIAAVDYQALRRWQLVDTTIDIFNPLWHVYLICLVAEKMLIRAGPDASAHYLAAAFGDRGAGIAL